jgi:hypothetical protein
MTKIPTVNLTVAQILDTPAEFDHLAEVRSIGPAFVLVLEREAPLRIEVLASTASEFDALREARDNDWRFAALLDLFFDLQREEARDDLDPRKREHAARLTAGQRLLTTRVSAPSAFEEAKSDV